MELMFRSVISWYKKSFMVYFKFWVELVLGWKEIFDENGQIWPFLLQHDTPTPRRGAPPRRRSLRLGEPEPKFYEFSGPPRCSNAPPRRTC